MRTIRSIRGTVADQSGVVKNGRRADGRPQVPQPPTLEDAERPLKDAIDIEPPGRGNEVRVELILKGRVIARVIEGGDHRQQRGIEHACFLTPRSLGSTAGR
jgi:hypothetical protein